MIKHDEITNLKSHNQALDTELTLCKQHNEKIINQNKNLSNQLTTIDKQFVLEQQANLSKEQVVISLSAKLAEYENGLETLKHQLIQMQTDIHAKDAQLNAQEILIENLNSVVKLVGGNSVFYQKQ